MRTHLIRSVLSAAILVTCVAVTAMAQPVVRGRVLDPSGNPVPDVIVTFVAGFQNLTRTAKTDGKGEFLVVGLPSGQYKVTATKEGVGTDTISPMITQGQNPLLTFNLKPAAPAGPTIAPAGGDAAANKAAQALQALAKIGSDHLTAGRFDEAIAAYTEVTAQAPTCADCFFNLGIGHAAKKEWEQAEAAFKKTIELKPDNARAHSQLAGVYNQQRKFDLAAEASANAAKYSPVGADGATGANAEALYNQGVILFNGGKFPEAKAAFEGATKADPKMALAHYQLGMTALNLGDFALAVSSLEQYLALDPDGPKAAEVKASLPTLKGMVKK